MNAYHILVGQMTEYCVCSLIEMFTPSMLCSQSSLFDPATSKTNWIEGDNPFDTLPRDVVRLGLFVWDKALPTLSANILFLCVLKVQG